MILSLHYAKPIGEIEVDQEMKIGGKDVRIDHPLPSDQFYSGLCFGRGAPIPRASSPTMPSPPPRPFTKKFTPLRPSIGLNTTPKPTIPLYPVSLTGDAFPDGVTQSYSQESVEGSSTFVELAKTPSKPTYSTIAPNNFYGNKAKPKRNGPL